MENVIPLCSELDVSLFTNNNKMKVIEHFVQLRYKNTAAARCPLAISTSRCNVDEAANLLPCGPCLLLPLPLLVVYSLTLTLTLALTRFLVQYDACMHAGSSLGDGLGTQRPRPDARRLLGGHHVRGVHLGLPGPLGELPRTHVAHCAAPEDVRGPRVQ
jgi:hypothetical protein